jgi:hypothetical protein
MAKLTYVWVLKAVAENKTIANPFAPIVTVTVSVVVVRSVYVVELVDSDAATYT